MFTLKNKRVYGVKLSELSLVTEDNNQNGVNQKIRFLVNQHSHFISNVHSFCESHTFFFDFKLKVLTNIFVIITQSKRKSKT